MKKILLILSMVVLSLSCFSQAPIRASKVTSDSTITKGIRIINGASNGYVLKSDAQGKASWQASSSNFKGSWNAHANIPVLSDATGINADYYIVSLGDTINLGSGNKIFITGGFAIHNGSVWESVTPSQVVTSVNSRLGNVQLDLSRAGDSVKITGGTGVLITPMFAGLRDSTRAVYHTFMRQLESDGENNIDVGFTILPKAQVFYNGQAIPSTCWTGAGSSTLVLDLDTRIYDLVIINN